VAAEAGELNEDKRGWEGHQKGYVVGAPRRQRRLGLEDEKDVL